MLLHSSCSIFVSSSFFSCIAFSLASISLSFSFRVISIHCWILGTPSDSTSFNVVRRPVSIQRCSVQKESLLGNQSHPVGKLKILIYDCNLVVNSCCTDCYISYQYLHQFHYRVQYCRLQSCLEVCKPPLDPFL